MAEKTCEQIKDIETTVVQLPKIDNKGNALNGDKLADAHLEIHVPSKHRTRKNTDSKPKQDRGPNHANVTKERTEKESAIENPNIEINATKITPTSTAITETTDTVDMPTIANATMGTMTIVTDTTDKPKIVTDTTNDQELQVTKNDTIGNPHQDDAYHSTMTDATTHHAMIDET